MTDRRSQARPGPAAPMPSDLAARVRAVLPSLSPAQTRIARVIESDPAGVAALTVTKLAERAATSAATVVRAARSLGFEGYPQLRLALAAHGASIPSDDGVPLGADIADGDPPGVVLAKLAAFESEQIRATAELVDPAALGKVVALVRTSRRIDVYGIGASGLVAQDLTQKLCRIGLDCRSHTDHDAAMVSACLLGASCLSSTASSSASPSPCPAPCRRCNAPTTSFRPVRAAPDREGRHRPVDHRPGHRGRGLSGAGHRGRGPASPSLTAVRAARPATAAYR